MLVDREENVFPDLKMCYKSWMPARGKEFLKNLACTAKDPPRGHTVEIETVRVVYVMWKLQLEIYKKTQQAGSPAMNAFIHKCACIHWAALTSSDLEWESTRIISSTAWVRPQRLREMCRYLGHGYFHHLAVSDGKALKNMIFQTIVMMVNLRPQLIYCCPFT